MFPSSVYNTIICVMYKLIQPTISFKILVQNQDTFSILEILLKVSLKHHKLKPSVYFNLFFCDFTFSFTGEKIHTIYILAFSAQRGQNQKNGES
jgi:hypothetical protein